MYLRAIDQRMYDLMESMFCTPLRPAKLDDERMMMMKVMVIAGGSVHDGGGGMWW